ncbi:acetyl-coenzyme A synthetase, partial [Patescibacteria group bacterium]|nr:acetyl-coenzyme A synthetase [Patescibacteria group bacterium]
MSEVKKPIFQPNPQFAANARIKSMDEYLALQKMAQDDYEGFWDKFAKEKIDWFKPYTQVLDESNAPFYKWFTGGKLNVTHQCIDRHLSARKNKAAIIFEGDRGDKQIITYLELYYNVNKFANLLKNEFSTD